MVAEGKCCAIRTEGRNVIIIVIGSVVYLLSLILSMLFTIFIDYRLFYLSAINIMLHNVTLEDWLYGRTGELDPHMPNAC